MRKTHVVAGRANTLSGRSVGRMSLESVKSDRPQPDPKDEGDEAIISMSVAGEVTDSSIMEVGRSRPQFQYSREELLEIKAMPLAKRRPDCLDIAYNNSRGVWDPERWHLNRKRSDTPTEEEQRASRGEHIPEPPGNKRRSGDPRERIRKEQDGIVLSPQRRSFNSGCFVNVTQPPPRRPESPIGKPEVSHREPVRRIGSGRLLNRDMWDEGWDPKHMFMKPEKLEPERSEFAFRTSANAVTRDRDSRDTGRDREPMRDRDNVRDREDRGDRYERRSFGRDFGERDGARDRGPERNERGHPMDRGRDRRYGGNERRRTYGEPEEPEWFSGGPTSQHDTIELRGFDDIPEEKTSAKGKKQSPAQKKRGKKNAAEKDEKQQLQTGESSSAVPKGRSTPTAMDQPMNPVHAPHSPISEQNEEQTANRKERSNTSENATTECSEMTDRSDNKSKSRDENPSDFNLDDFLKSDTFPGVSGLLTNGVGAETGSGSRFSQWFKRESPVQQMDSRRASIQDELLNNLLNDITEPNIQIPSTTESNAYFAPISPANTTSNTENPATGVKLLEMLQRGSKPNQNGQGDAASVVPMMKNSTIKDIEVGGKVFHSLEELEARMRGAAPTGPSIEPPRVNKTEEDLSAFKKLLAQVTGGQAVPAANGPIAQKPPPMTLIQMLNNQLKAQQPPVPEPMHPPSFNHVGPLGPAQHPHQAQMQHENLMKVLRIQQQQQQQKQRAQAQSDMLSMMMSGQQRMVGVSPVPQDIQMLVNNAPSSREPLQRPEAQAIIRGLQQGEITRQHLIQQLQNPAMQHRHRDLLVNILKMFGGTTPRTVSPHAGPVAPHDQILQQMLYQQQQQQQQQQRRIPSPMNNAFCPPPIISPNLATSPNTLSVQHPVIPHRVPSPRGLVMNTQTIMQNALIKQKLEEQLENFLKRQEQQQQPQMQQQQQQQQQQQMTSPVNSPSKQTLSPTPLAFTPTSVLRKMTAEKELDGNSEPAKLAAQTQQAVEIQQMQSAVQLIAQGVLSRQKTPMGIQPSQAQAQAQAQASWASPPVKQHPGRPIVKVGSGTGGFPYAAYGPQSQQQQPPQQQPQQPQKPPQPQRPSPTVYVNSARSKHTMATPMPPHPNVTLYNVTPTSVMNQRPSVMNNHMKAQQQQQHQPQPVQSYLATMQQQQRASQVQLVLNQQNNAARTDGRIMRSQQMNMTVGRQSSPGSNGGSLSPTSNQLARWFSPELLAKARAGKLPELGQTNVLSLEELERLQYASTTVHN